MHDLAATINAYATAGGLSVIPISTANKRPIGALLPQLCDFPRRTDPRTKALDSGRGHGSWLDAQYMIAPPEAIARWLAPEGLLRGVQAARRAWSAPKATPPPPEIQARLLAEPVGVAVACGQVSGGLLVIDFDDAGFYRRWRAGVVLPAGVLVQQTGSGGYQVWLRCARPGRNEKLAFRVQLDERGYPARDENGHIKRKIAIETRGEAGYAVLAPSLHPSGRRYAILEGDPLQIPVIDQDTVAGLLAAATALDELAAVEPKKPTPPPTKTYERTYRESVNGSGGVIDQFNQHYTIEAQLAAAGYVEVGSGSYRGRWVRPGSDSGNPSVVVRDGKSYHHNSADPLSNGHWNNAFDVFLEWEHRGDVKRAVADAAKRLGLPPLPREFANTVAPDAVIPHPAEAGSGARPPRHRSIMSGLQVYDPPAEEAGAEAALSEPSPEPLRFRAGRRDRPTLAEPPNWQGSPDSVQDQIRAVVLSYLAERPEPGVPFPMVLVRVPPGGRKTSTSVELSEFVAQPDARGHQERVIYYGPRHTLFADLMREAKQQHWWKEWQSRHSGDKLTGEGATCAHAAPLGGGHGAINIWLHRNHDAMDFCVRICGFDYIKNECVYHAQKNTTKPILYLQHQHLWAGVPGDLRAIVGFGDELPLGAMLWQWEIPAKWVVPPDMDPTEPLTELLHALHTACRDQGRVRLSGAALLDALGGAAEVLSVIEDYERRKASLPAGLPSVVEREEERERSRERRRRRRRERRAGGRRGRMRHQDDVTLRHPSDAEKAPFKYVRDLLWHLRREATEAAAGRPYEPRLVAGHDMLILLQRRRLHDSVPQHLIWLDGTGDPAIYEAIFGRPVRVVELDLPVQGTVYQVINRAYGKRSLIELAPPDAATALIEEARGEEGEAPAPPTAVLTRQAREALEVIDRITARNGYERHGLISFQQVTTQVAERFSVVAHFYGSRGSNAFTDRPDGPGVDALSVLGTPIPDPYALRKLAAMLYLERMEPFDMTWEDRYVPYRYRDKEGNGWSYPVANFWNEPALAALVRQVRESEIVQAAERARLRLRQVDVWLFTNLPLDDLPPTHIVTIEELLRGNQNLPVDPYRWARVLELAEACYSRGEPISAARLSRELGIAAPTARRYIDHLRAAQPERWEAAELAPRGRGRPSQGLRPTYATGTDS